RISSRRQHTRFSRDWSSDVCSSDLPLDAFTVNGADFFYTVPNHYVRAIKNEMAHNATPSGQLRSVAPGWTFWAVESMVDEIAHEIGRESCRGCALCRSLLTIAEELV